MHLEVETGAEAFSQIALTTEEPGTAKYPLPIREHPELQVQPPPGWQHCNIILQYYLFGKYFRGN